VRVSTKTSQSEHNQINTMIRLDNFGVGSTKIVLQCWMTVRLGLGQKNSNVVEVKAVNGILTFPSLTWYPVAKLLVIWLNNKYKQPRDSQN
jgi:hypothetical protein